MPYGTVTSDWPASCFGNDRVKTGHETTKISGVGSDLIVTRIKHGFNGFVINTVFGVLSKPSDIKTLASQSCPGLSIIR